MYDELVPTRLRRVLCKRLLSLGFSVRAFAREGRDGQTKVAARGGRAATRTNGEAADHRAVQAVSRYMTLSPGFSVRTLARAGRDGRTKAG